MIPDNILNPFLDIYLTKFQRNTLKPHVLKSVPALRRYLVDRADQGWAKADIYHVTLVACIDKIDGLCRLQRHAHDVGRGGEPGRDVHPLPRPVPRVPPQRRRPVLQ